MELRTFWAVDPPVKLWKEYFGKMYLYDLPLKRNKQQRSEVTSQTSS